MDSAWHILNPMKSRGYYNYLTGALNQLWLAPFPDSLGLVSCLSSCLLEPYSKYQVRAVDHRLA